MTDWRDDYNEGDRVRAVNFTLDEGLRIWPVDAGAGEWRVVRVADQAVQEELCRGSQFYCQNAHPDATFGINDNETVPPGTLGTVDHKDASNLHVKWDNGSSIAATERDTIEKV